MIEFSELARLGDLRQYTLSELKAHLSDWDFRSYPNDEFTIAEWSNSRSSLKVLYSTSGLFIQIIEERWKAIFRKDKVFRR
jgi:hypothetical protein